jgi:hypothetical protein
LVVVFVVLLQSPIRRRGDDQMHALRVEPHLPSVLAVKMVLGGYLRQRLFDRAGEGLVFGDPWKILLGVVESPQRFGEEPGQFGLSRPLTRQADSG